MKSKEEKIGRQIDFGNVIIILLFLFVIYLFIIARFNTPERTLENEGWQPECTEYKTITSWVWAVDDCIENPQPYLQKLHSSQRNLTIADFECPYKITYSLNESHLPNTATFFSIYCKLEDEYEIGYDEYECVYSCLSWSNVITNFCKHNFNGVAYYYTEDVCIKESLSRDAN